MRKLIYKGQLLLLITFIFISCSEIGELKGDFLLKDIKVWYLLFNDGVRYEETRNGNIAFSELDSLIIQRKSTDKTIVVGCPVAGDPLSGGGIGLSNRVKDSIAVRGNSYHVYTVPDVSLLYKISTEPYVEYIIEDKKLQYIKRRDGVEYFYTYDNDRIIEKNNNLINRIFYFEDDNLIKVERFSYTLSYELSGKTVREFIDYDLASNPLYGKFYINGAFFRAFSKNNYLKYSSKYYSLVEGAYVLKESDEFYVKIKYNDAGYPLLGNY